MSNLVCSTNNTTPDYKFWRPRASELAQQTFNNCFVQTIRYPYWYNADKTWKWTTKRGLDLETLTKHFEGLKCIGCPSIDPATSTSIYLGFDIDYHESPNEQRCPQSNFQAALEIWDRLRGLGFVPALEDSNGRGGYHVWLFFKVGVDAAVVRSFGHWVASQCPTARDLKIEIFPKQSKLGSTGTGNQLRLPGCHHRTDHWSRFWTGSEWQQGPDEFVRAISCRESAALIPDEARDFVPPCEARKITPCGLPSGAEDWIWDYDGDLSTLDIEALCEHVGCLTGGYGRGGGLEITCPWAASHTTGDDYAMVWPIEDGKSKPGFRCFHSHCDNKTIEDFLAAVGNETVSKFCARKRTEHEKKQHRIGAELREAASMLEEYITAPDLPAPETTPKTSPMTLDDYEDAGEADAEGEEPRGKKGKPSQVTLLVEYVQNHCDLWQNQKTGWATVDGQNFKIHSSAFRQWLSGSYYEQRGCAAADKAIRSAIEIIGHLCLKCPQHAVYLRVARLENKIYWDLANDAQEIIEITADGWKVTKSCPVKFRRNNCSGELPLPQQGGSLDLLRPLINATDDMWTLMQGVLLDFVKGFGPYYILVVGGEQGSAKTTTCKLIKMLVDPGKTAQVGALPQTENDLGVAGENEFLLAFDNLSHLKTEMSDSLCKVSTGAGLKKRALYTDDEQKVFDICRPQLLNGIPDFADKPDLMSRAINLILPIIDPQSRKTEKQLNADFERIRPLLLGALCDLMVQGLRRFDAVSIPEIPRMADTAKWVTACLGNQDFVQACLENEREAATTLLEHDGVAKAIMDIIKNQDPFQKMIFTPTQFAERVKHANSSGAQLELPRSAKGLSTAITRVAPLLRQQRGIDIKKTRNMNERLITIEVMTDRMTDHDGS